MLFVVGLFSRVSLYYTGVWLLCLFNVVSCCLTLVYYLCHACCDDVYDVCCMYVFGVFLVHWL